ncbi:MAG: hypothetical protein Q4A16_08345 [Lautropia sp.]|nr:hypothetical protein [Lautropia sp.]
MATPAQNFSVDTPPAELLAHFVPFLRIAHQIPGRVRFKFDASAGNGVKFDASTADSDTLTAVLKQTRGIKNIGWNLLARSCTVEYDPQVLPDDAWADLLAGRSSAATAVLHAILEETHANLRNAINRRSPPERYRPGDPGRPAE